MKGLLKNLTLILIWNGALRRLQREKPFVVAVTGSIGKTSAKEAIALVLDQTSHPVVKTAGNMATETGVPLSLLGFSEPPEGVLAWLRAVWRSLFPPGLKIKETRPFYVLEYSADKPGDIAYLAKRIPPDVAVFTRITPVHLQAYRDFSELVKEKISLLDYLQPGGLVIYNGDDPEQVKAIAEKDIANKLTYRLEKIEKEGLHFQDIKYGKTGLQAILAFRLPKKLEPPESQSSQAQALKTKVFGKHQLYSLLAAAGVGFTQGLSISKVCKALSEYEIPNGRGRLIEGKKNMLIIDDTYNASPEAVKAGLEMLREVAGERRVVAILGNMNELGEVAEMAHQEVGSVAAKTVDFLVAVGQNAEVIVKAAKRQGLPAVQMIDFASTEQLMDKIDQVVQSNDLVYIKGSQNGVRLERVVKLLMAHPDQAQMLLVRQQGNWKKNI